MLRTNSQASSDEVYIFSDAESVDVRIANRWWDETGQHGYGGGLAGSIVAQKRRDLTLVHVEIEPVHSDLALLSILQFTLEQTPC